MKCTAVSSRTGLPCKAKAIKGGAVCRVHGGSAPQVRRAANDRLLELVAPAVARLKRIVEKGEDPVALGAARDILNRAGIGTERDAGQRELGLGEQRVSFSWEAIGNLRETDPAKWARIMALAREMATLPQGEQE